MYNIGVTCDAMRCDAMRCMYGCMDLPHTQLAFFALLLKLYS